MKDIGSLMKQAQVMQAKLQEAQASWLSWRSRARPATVW